MFLSKKQMVCGSSVSLKFTTRKTKPKTFHNLVSKTRRKIIISSSSDSDVSVSTILDLDKMVKNLRINGLSFMKEMPLIEKRGRNNTVQNYCCLTNNF